MLIVTQKNKHQTKYKGRIEIVIDEMYIHIQAQWVMENSTDVKVFDMFEKTAVDTIEWTQEDK